MALFQLTPNERTDEQRALLDDDEIDIEKEKERCANYNFGYDGRTERRRLFLGTLLADDSFEVLKAVSTEVYNMFHTVSFIESNVTHNLSPREMRFYDPDKPSPNLYKLYQIYGPKTKVSVDYYSCHMQGGHDLLRDFTQREGNNFRWKMNGMTVDDIAIVGDTDETFTRDFLRALQICDVPNFRPGQDCNNPGFKASTFVFESTPECLTKGRRWFHPDAMIGECVDQIGDITKHPFGKREWPHPDKVHKHTVYHGYRLKGYGGDADYSKYHEENKFENGHVPYPLYYATDQRMEGGSMIQKKDGSPAGYHFHNFFESQQEIHHKYLTYGHAWGGANEKPIWELHEDIALGVDCFRGKYEKAHRFDEIKKEVSSERPIYYINEKNRLARHEKWGQVIHDDENWWNALNGKHPEAGKNVDGAAAEQSTSKVTADEGQESVNQNAAAMTDWESSKSAVLGLATNYGLNVYQGKRYCYHLFFFVL
jgi:hypothetical protein